MTVRPFAPLVSPVARVACAAVFASLVAASCADPLDADAPLMEGEEPNVPVVVIGEGDEPVDGSADSAVSYTFEVDLRVAEQLYVIGRSHYDGAVEVIVPSGEVEAFDAWSTDRGVEVTGPNANFIAVMQGDNVDAIEQALELTMTNAGPVCAACGFDCRVLAPNEVGCQPMCDQCDAQAVLGNTTSIDAPVDPYGPHAHDDDPYGDCNPRFDCD